MRSLLLFLFTVFVLQNTCFSQSISRSVIGSSGRYASNATTKMYANVGEIAISTFATSNNNFTEGFVQPPFATSVGVPAYSNSETGISLYPNPTTTSFYITTTKTTTLLAVDIYDVQGRIVMSFQNIAKSADNSYSINISLLDNGVYFVKTTAGDKNSKPIITRLVKM